MLTMVIVRESPEKRSKYLDTVFEQTNNMSRNQ